MRCQWKISDGCKTSLAPLEERQQIRALYQAKSASVFNHLYCTANRTNQGDLVKRRAWSISAFPERCGDKTVTAYVDFDRSTPVDREARENGVCAYSGHDVDPTPSITYAGYAAGADAASIHFAWMIRA